MPTYLVADSFATVNSGNATSFRIYGNSVHNALEGGGWVQTADTGQADWSSQAANGTANATQTNAFEIWRADDAWQNTTPIFFKLEYRTFYQTNNPGFVLTFGSGSDGSGNLTGLLSTALTIRMDVRSVATTNYWRVAPGEITIAMGWISTGQGLLFAIERERDASGNTTSGGVCVVLSGGITTGSSALWQQFVWFPNIGTVASESTVGVFTPSLAGAAVTSGNKGLLHGLYFYKGVLTNPSLNLLGGHIGLTPANTPVDFTMYNATHRYVNPQNALNIWTLRSGVASTNFPLLIRWEE